MDYRQAFALTALVALAACDDDELICNDRGCTPLIIDIELEAGSLTAPTIQVVADGASFMLTCSVPPLDTFERCVTEGGEMGEDHTVWAETLGREDGTVSFIINATNYGSAETIGPGKFAVSIDGGGGELFVETFEPDYEDQGEVWGPGCGTCSTAEIERPLAD